MLFIISTCNNLNLPVLKPFHRTEKKLWSEFRSLLKSMGSENRMCTFLKSNMQITGNKKGIVGWEISLGIFQQTELNANIYRLLVWCWWVAPREVNSCLKLAILPTNYNAFFFRLFIFSCRPSCPEKVKFTVVRTSYIALLKYL